MGELKSKVEFVKEHTKSVLENTEENMMIGFARKMTPFERNVVVTIARANFEALYDSLKFKEHLIQQMTGKDD